MHEKITINLVRSLPVFAFSIALVKLKQIRFVVYLASFTAQKMKFSIKDIFSNSDQSRRFLRIWSHLLKKSLMENFIFCAMVFFLYLSFLSWPLNYWILIVIHSSCFFNFRNHTQNNLKLHHSFFRSAY